MFDPSIAALIGLQIQPSASPRNAVVKRLKTILPRWIIVVFFWQSFGLEAQAQIQVNGYVTNRGSNDLSVINTTSQDVTTTVSVGSLPYGVAVTPDGRYVYVNNHTSVSVISATTNTVVQTIQFQVPADSNHFLDAIPASPDGKFVYTAQGNFAGLSDNFLNVISTATNSVVATIPVGEGAQGLAVAPNSSNWVGMTRQKCYLAGRKLLVCLGYCASFSPCSSGCCWRPQYSAPGRSLACL